MLCNWGTAVWPDDSLRLLDEVLFTEFLLSALEMKICSGRSRGLCQG